MCWRQHRALLNFYEGAFGRVARRALDRHCVAAAEGVLIVELGSEEIPLPSPIEAITDRDEQRIQAIAWFDSKCPVVWVPGIRVWNVNQVGRYRVGRGLPIYVPEHPYYYHRAGKLASPDQLVESTLPTPSESLDDAAHGRKRHGDDRLALGKHRGALAAALATYRSLYERGPIALDTYTKTSGRFGKTPVTLWAEAMPLLRAQVVHHAAVVKGLEARLGAAIARERVSVTQLELF